MSINTHTASRTINKEVVVNVHAAQTTTSKAKHLGVITKPKRNLMTREQKPAPNIAHVSNSKARSTLTCTHFSAPSRAMLDIDVTKAELDDATHKVIAAQYTATW